MDFGLITTFSQLEAKKMTNEELIIHLAKEVIKLKSDVEWFRNLWLADEKKKREVKDESNE